MRNKTEHALTTKTPDDECKTLKKKENKTKNTQTPKHDARTQERLNNKEHKGPNMKSSH